ncbi:MAG: transcription termination factor Rho [Lachnospiraceae bacterium]|nr:transcription termination factor Rho [Lachnospiraceae bacterium]
MSVAELREMAKTLGIKGYEKLKKAEAYRAVMGVLRPEETAAPAPSAAETAPAKTGRRGRPRKDSAAAPADVKAEKTADKKNAKKENEAAKEPVRKGGRVKAQESKAAEQSKAPAKRGRKPAAKQSADAAPKEKRASAERKSEQQPGVRIIRTKVTRRDEDAKPARRSKEVRDDAALRMYDEEEFIPGREPDEDDELRLARAEAEERRAAAKALGIDLPPGVEDYTELESGERAYGILEVMAEGYGFLRSANYMPGEKDIYVSPSQIKRFSLRTGDMLEGPIRIKTGNEKFSALLYPATVNEMDPSLASARKRFESMTPIFPNERIHLERAGGSMSMRIMDLISPVGKGQRGMIVSPPKAGKTTLLKDVAMSVKANHPEMKLIILLIDERPEEVTDIKESIEGPNVEVIYSTFDELPEHHKRVSEMVLNRAKRLVEQGEDVMILLDSITRLSRAYNLVVAPSGRTLSGGLDPAALYMPKKFFGAARNIREGGSLTILATALVDTGSRMDDVVFEEFKGTGNMELVLDRKLSEKRVFPAMDIMKSGTRRDDLLLENEEYDTMYMIRKAVASLKPEEATEKILDLFAHTKTNGAFLQFAHKIAW